MKKYYLIFVFSLLSLLFLSPLNTYAYVDSSWHVPYQNSNKDTYTNYGGYWGSWSSVVTGFGEGSTSIYFSDVSMPPGKNDYLEFPIYVFFQSNNIEGDADIYNTGDSVGGLATTGYSIDFSMFTTYGNSSETTTTLCEFFPTTSFSNKVVSGTIRCNLNSLSNGLDHLMVHFNHMGYNTLQEYRVFFGTTGWINFIPHQGDIAANSIVSAQNQTTQAVQDATNAIESQNNILNDSSTTEANSSANSFFGNFGNHTDSHLTNIITAPLTLFNAMTTECTQPLEIPLAFNNLNQENTNLHTGEHIDDSTIKLACYANFWNRNDVQTFRSFWNLLLGVPCIYGLLVLLMKVINNAVDPLNDEIMTMTLDSGQLPYSMELEKEMYRQDIHDDAREIRRNRDGHYGGMLK